MDKYSVLKKYFGYTSFRDGQEEIIDSICSGRDVLGVLPTGTGKSVCYQIPAMMFKGVTIVISPLISLMNDQVKNLAAHKIKAVSITSLMPKSKAERIYRDIENGMYKIVYVAPERLFNERFLRLCASVDIPLAVVDEAHCVSQWGKDFRPDYLRIGEFVSKLMKRPVVAAFTASATPEIRREIAQILQLDNYATVVTGFDRPNLFFDVIKTDSKMEKTLEIVKKTEGTKIIYCSTRRKTEEVCRYLLSEGINACMYHAGLDSTKRYDARVDFISGKCDTIVATNAFGMGIDKPDVRLVINYGMTADMESYYQQAGRAGRDGLVSRCVILYSHSDRKVHEFLIEKSEENADSDDLQSREHRQLRYDKLDIMQRYCDGGECYRKQILEYFGQHSPERCEFCGYCATSKPLPDIGIYKRKSFRISRSNEYYVALKRASSLCAKRCHIPRHLLISNMQLKKIVKMRPSGMDELEYFCDFSRFQMNRAGVEILKVCIKYNNR